MAKKRKYNSAGRTGVKRGSYNKTKSNEKTKTVKTKGLDKIAIDSELVEWVKRNTRTLESDIIKRETVGNLETEKSNEDQSEMGSDNNIPSSEEQFNSSGTPESMSQDKSFQEKSGEEKLNEFFSEYNDEGEVIENKKDGDTDSSISPESSSPKNWNISKMVNGYMLLTLMDVVFPSAIKFLFGMIDKRAKNIKVKDVALTKEQKEALNDAADQVAVYIFEKVNPLVIFVICSAVFYGQNFTMALDEIKKEDK